MTIEGISVPSFAKSSGDLWVEAFEPLVGLHTSDPELREKLYPHDQAAWRDQVADTHWCCALSWRAVALELHVTLAPELDRPYEPRNGQAVSDVVAICRRHQAWIDSPPPGTIFPRGSVILLGQNPPAGGTPEDLARWRGEWGGAEHVVGAVREHDGDRVFSIDGGQARGPSVAAVQCCERTLSVHAGRLWLGGKRIAGFGLTDRIALAI